MNDSGDAPPRGARAGRVLPLRPEQRVITCPACGVATTTPAGVDLDDVQFGHRRDCWLGRIGL